MYEIVSADAVPASRSSMLAADLPIRSITIGEAIRVAIPEGIAKQELRKFWGALRARVCRAQSATGNRYRVTKAHDCIYISRLS